MPDITLCENLTCNMRGNCMRGQESDSEYQSYDTFIPENDHCHYFISIEKLGKKENGKKRMLARDVQKQELECGLSAKQVEN
jgi:hypothetical protein